MFYRLLRCYVFGVFQKMNLLLYVLFALFAFLLSIPLSGFLTSLKVDPGPWYYGSVLGLEAIFFFGFWLHGFLSDKIVIHGQAGNANRRRFFLLLDKADFKVLFYQERDFFFTKGREGFLVAFSFVDIPDHAWSEKKPVKSQAGVVEVTVPALGGKVNMEISLFLSRPYQAEEVVAFLAKRYFDRGQSWVCYEQYLVNSLLNFLPGSIKKAVESAQDIFGEVQPSAEEISGKLEELVNSDFRPELLPNVERVEVAIADGPIEEVSCVGEFEICEQEEDDDD